MKWLSRHDTAVAIMDTHQKFVFAQGQGLQHPTMDREDVLEAPPIPEELWSVVGPCWRGAMFFSGTVMGRLVDKKKFMKRRGCMRITGANSIIINCTHLSCHIHTHTYTSFS